MRNPGLYNKCWILEPRQIRIIPVTPVAVQCNYITSETRARDKIGRFTSVGFFSSSPVSWTEERVKQFYYIMTTERIVIVLRRIG